MAVLIRLAREEDAATIASIYRHYVDRTPISFEDSPPDAAEMKRRILGERPGYHPWFVAEEGERLLGYAASSPFRSRSAYRWTVETGIYLAADAGGRGIGRELLTTLLGVLERQGYVAAIGAIALPNEASVALHEKLGFAPAATYRDTGFKLGAWRTVQVFARDLAPRLTPPLEIRPFADVA